MEYFVYIYLTEEGIAYYVGKGKRSRIFMRHDVPVPSRNCIQYFPFATEQEAWDTEIQLIALFGRQQDGGTLMNLSTGGKSGTAGLVHTPERRLQQSRATKARIAKRGHPQQGKRGADSHNSLTYQVVTPEGETIVVRGLTEYCRRYNLHPSAMVKVSKGKQRAHKGYRCSRI